MKTPFKIQVPAEVIIELKRRLAQTRWPDETTNSNWEMGTNLDYLQSLCTFWQTDFDWAAAEDYLNGFCHFKSMVDNVELHFILEKGKGRNSFPLLLTHGFPDSFTRFLKLIPLLTAEDKDGFSFDVIVPSIPGYGFSGKPTEAGMTPQRIAQLFTRLLTAELGYNKFFAHGGDWGSSITEQIANHHAEHLMGMHLTDIPYYHLFEVPADDLTEPEKAYLEKGKKWQMSEGAYAMIQSTTPQTAAYGLNDSPAGLAGWILEKFYRWSDNHGNLELSFTKDELLTNLTIYWVTETINSAMRIYYETARQTAGEKPPANKLITPAGVAIFPKDLVPAPKEYGERIYNIKQWTEMKEGGHFAALEHPDLLAEDIRKFVKAVV